MSKDTITLKNGELRIIKATLTYMRNMRLPLKTQLKVVSLQKAVNDALIPFEEVCKPLYEAHAKYENGRIVARDGRIEWKSPEDEAAFNAEYEPLANESAAIELETAKKFTVDELDDITFTGDAAEIFMPFIQE